ncbi:MAG: hypothetical protein LQ338_002054 [Usnochroma carphineum]|nr:MAG: hypothetical protein LQ338_002054 [Usnochroma carphineum]
MPRPPATLSPLEELLLGAEKPTAMLVHLYHSFFHDTVPADYMLANLPLSSIITLRAVSHTTRDWVDQHYPDLLTKLQVTCPLPRAADQWGSVLRRLSHACVHLTINVSPSSTPITRGTFPHYNPAGQIFNIVYNFSSLRIVPPAKDAFEPLLSLRLALESTSLKNLTHIHIEPLDIAGLLSLRWGGFDTLQDATWIGQSFWRGVKSLRIGMASQWLNYAHTDLKNQEDEVEKNKQREERELYRQAIQALHNYLFQFSVQNTLGKLRFDWIDGDMIGPNPLLLDEEVAKGGGEWFSAPGTTWRGLKEVWLGGVAVDGADTTILKQRMEGLEKMMIGESLAAREIKGKIQVIESKEWLNVDLNDTIQVVQEYGEVENLFDTEDEGPRSRAESMVVPFVLIN